MGANQQAYVSDNEHSKRATIYQGEPPHRARHLLRLALCTLACGHLPYSYEHTC